MKKAIGYVYVIAAAVCWGFLGLFNRVLTAAGVSLLNMMPLRFGGTAILFTVFCMMFKQQVFHIKLRHLPIFLGSGLISMLLVLCGCALVSGIVGSDVGISLEGLLMGLASELCYGGYTILLLIQKKGNRGTIPLGCWTNLAPSGTADAFLNPVGLRPKPSNVISKMRRTTCAASAINQTGQQTKPAARLILFKEML